MIGGSVFFPDPPRPVAGAAETHRLVASGSGLALAVQFEQRNGVAGFQTVVFGLETAESVESHPVVISAVDIGLGQAWELRTSGLWAEQVRERSFDHWSYGLEAFALAIDEPDELLRRAHGHRVPLGWELDFVATEPPEPAPSQGEGSFVQTGTVDGVVLTAAGQRDMRGRAFRSYSSAPPPDHTDIDEVTLDTNSRPDSVILPTMFGPWTVRESPGPR